MRTLAEAPVLVMSTSHCSVSRSAACHFCIRFHWKLACSRQTRCTARIGVRQACRVRRVLPHPHHPTEGVAVGFVAQRAGGAQALRLDEIELLLGIGQQRLRLDDDIDGARRALALAAPLLDGLDDPAYLNLRQALAQEQAALQALGMNPVENANQVYLTFEAYF